MSQATGNYAQALFQHTNGMLYGDSYQGGKFGIGVFYSLDAGSLPPFVTYLPTYGRPGALVQILGQGFTAGSVVSFNGTPAASPVVVYPTYLRVIVPSGATTGLIAAAPKRISSWAARDSLDEPPNRDWSPALGKT